MIEKKLTDIKILLVINTLILWLHYTCFYATKASEDAGDAHSGSPTAFITPVSLLLFHCVKEANQKNSNSRYSPENAKLRIFAILNKFNSFLACLIKLWSPCRILLISKLNWQKPLMSYSFRSAMD